VAKRSEGSIRIDVSPEWHREKVDFEAGVVRAVRAHRADLGVVGARVWDTLGVTSLQAMIAPFLVDNLSRSSAACSRARSAEDARRRVAWAAASKASRFCRDRCGCRSVLTRPLVRRADYAGFRMGAYPGRVEALTHRALGARFATTSASTAPARGRGPELLGRRRRRRLPRQRRSRRNVVFWPRPETVVMNRGAFEALTPAQAAGARRRRPEMRSGRVSRRSSALEKNAVASICQRKLASLVTAPRSGRRRAASGGPARLTRSSDRNAETRDLIARVRALRARRADGERRASQLPTAARGPDTVAARRLVEVERFAEALLSRGASAAEAATYEGPGTLELRAGSGVSRRAHDRHGDVLR
jgi:hypothetical protein